MTSVPVALPAIRVPRTPRTLRARAAVCLLVLGFAGMPHFLRALTSATPTAPLDSAILAALGFFVLTLAFAGVASGRSTWGALQMDEVLEWTRDAGWFVTIAVGLFVPAALLDLRTPPLVPALAAVVLPAATEEFAYRGVLLVALHRLLASCKVRAEFRPALAVMLGSVAFAAAHDSLLTPDRSLAAAFQRASAGLLLGFVALRSRSLLGAMFAHAAFNAVVQAPWFDA